jgi:hypothetical protein
MVYEFMGKILNIRKPELLEENRLQESLAAIHSKFENPFAIRVLTESEPKNEILIKGQTSVSSYAKLHDDELMIAIETFREYLREIAEAINGVVSMTEGFYNNTKSYNRLW